MDSSRSVNKALCVVTFRHAIIESLSVGRPLVPDAEIREITRFALQALASEQQGGAPVALNRL
jgi:hypothetical protein